MTLVWAMIALSFIDFGQQLLPDSITMPFLWLGLALNFAGVYCNLHDAVLGAILGYGVLWTVFQVFRLVTGKEGMGYGDFKLLGMLGAWQGWQMLPAIVLLSSIIGASVGLMLIWAKGQDRATPIPFGPYLVLAGLVTLFYGPDINDHYLRLGSV